jgi:hypothetical protein
VWEGIDAFLCGAGGEHDLRKQPLQRLIDLLLPCRWRHSSQAPANSRHDDSGELAISGVDAKPVEAEPAAMPARFRDVRVANRIAGFGDRSRQLR